MKGKTINWEFKELSNKRGIHMYVLLEKDGLFSMSPFLSKNPIVDKIIYPELRLNLKLQHGILK